VLIEINLKTTIKNKSIILKPVKMTNEIIYRATKKVEQKQTSRHLVKNNIENE